LSGILLQIFNAFPIAGKISCQDLNAVQEYGKHKNAQVRCAKFQIQIIALLKNLPLKGA
jgi:hypothetical protein